MLSNSPKFSIAVQLVLCTEKKIPTWEANEIVIEQDEWDKIALLLGMIQNTVDVSTVKVESAYHTFESMHMDHTAIFGDTDDCFIKDLRDVKRKSSKGVHRLSAASPRRMLDPMTCAFISDQYNTHAFNKC
ncbi:hypothetical protein Tco_1074499 [Tanacetum coccineum]